MNLLFVQSTINQVNNTKRVSQKNLEELLEIIQEFEKKQMSGDSKYQWSLADQIGIIRDYLAKSRLSRKSRNETFYSVKDVVSKRLGNIEGRFRKID